MKSQISLKWKLTLSLLMVVVILGFLIALVMQYLLTGFDERIFEEKQRRALANSEALGSEMSYQLIARQKNEAKDGIKEFLEKHVETHSISVLDNTAKEFVSVGTQVNTSELTSAFEPNAVEKSKHVGSLIVAITTVKDDNGSKLGSVIYTESLESYFEFRTRVAFLATGVGLIGLGFIMLFAFLLGARTARPINNLVDAAQRIADGDLESIEVEASGSLETSRLATSIRSMASALQKQVMAVKTLTGDITSASKDVSSTMAHLASSASQQAAAVTETAATVEEMEQAGRSAAGNAKQIVDAAEKTREASTRGRGAVETTTAIIARIQEDSQVMSDQSKNLLSSVEEVGNIIRSVNAIAEQSKILAVNASIEAAKAGEYGSGFAVVAQEVKDLAQQSKDSTLQITVTLTAIRQAIESMVETALGGKERTEEGVDMISNAGAIMNDLSEAIRENSSLANVIATNINQQTVGLTQIATSIEEINSTALENQNISRKIVGSSNQMSESFVLLNDKVGNWRTPDLPEEETSLAG